MNREKRIELDFVRAVAMLAVLVLHVTSTFIDAPSRFTILGMNLAFLLNQASRFCVPLFLLLSGTSLGHSRKNLSSTAFIKARAAKLLPPYLFWTLAYWVQSFTDGTAAWQGAETALQVLRSLLLGSAASHLYFIVVIFQCYLLYPILKRLMKHYPVQLTLFALVLSLFIQQIIRMDLQPALLRPYLWKFFPTWLFYFVLGMLIHHFGVEKLSAFAGRNVVFLAALTALYGFWYCRESFLTRSLESVKPQLFLYAPLVLALLLGMGDRLSHVQPFRRAVGFLAGHSQTVFFLHLLVLIPLRHIPLMTWGMQGMLLLLALTVVLSLLSAWAFDRAAAFLVRRLPRSGNPKV